MKAPGWLLMLSIMFAGLWMWLDRTTHQVFFATEPTPTSLWVPPSAYGQPAPVQILEPWYGARVVSPLRIHLRVHRSSGSRLELSLWKDRRVPIYREVVNLQTLTTPTESEWLDIVREVPFEIREPESQALLYAHVSDSQGGPVYRQAVQLTLARFGLSQPGKWPVTWPLIWVQTPQPHEQWPTFTHRYGQPVMGKAFYLSGKIQAGLMTPDGRIGFLTWLPQSAPDAYQMASFQGELQYKDFLPGPVFVVVRLYDPITGHLFAFTRIPITLAGPP